MKIELAYFLSRHCVYILYIFFYCTHTRDIIGCNVCVLNNSSIVREKVGQLCHKKNCGCNYYNFEKTLVGVTLMKGFGKGNSASPCLNEATSKTSTA